MPGANAITLRSVVLGLLLIPVNAWWMMQVEHIRYSDNVTTSALFFNCIALLLILVGWSAVMRRVAPWLALGRGEMLTVYAMVVLASNLAGHDQMQILLATLVQIWRGASPVNNWASEIHPALPRWLMGPSSGSALSALYVGHSSLYFPSHLQAWIGPTIWWSLFVVILTGTMLCLSAIFRRQWDHERLTYPIAEIPLWVTSPTRQLFRSGPLWFGFGIAFLLQLQTMIPFWYPGFPSLNLGVRGYMATDMPWRACGHIPICFFPFVFGLAYLLPTELAFCVWFFPLLGRLEMVAAAWLGVLQPDGPPYLMQQEMGAFLGVAGVVIWAARGHLRRVWLQAWGQRALDDTTEPLRYGMAFWGFVAGMALLVVFAVLAGMQWATALIYFVWLMATVLTAARVRAEFGLPTLEMCCQVGVDDAMMRVAGQNTFPLSDRIVLTLFFWLNRTSRQFPMPNQMDAFRLGQRAGLRLPRLTWVLLLASALGALSVFWAYLHTSYQVGMESAAYTGVAVWAFGEPPWKRLALTIANPLPPDRGATVAYLVGILVTLGFGAMRARFIWWPFYPVGYLLTGSYGVLRMWFPILITWLIKSGILRYGGLKTHLKTLPFFMGLVLGSFAAGFLRTLIDLMWNLHFPSSSGIGGL
ncbi:MAG: hypothetical protein GX100_12845 [candidate division WS1 bacterium]|nr:hypothetical protein [candidate division WS1 bacterium]